MRWRRFGTFYGGIDLPDEKQATEDLSITPWTGLSRLRVPLAPCGGSAAEPVVSAGRTVAAGQLIARAIDHSSVDIFAPLPGTVGNASEVDVYCGGRFVPSAALELTELGPALDLPAADEDDSWRQTDADALRQRIAEGGLTTCRRPLGPLASLLGRAVRHQCSTLIANVMESEPFVTADHRILIEQAHHVVQGLAILARAAEAERVIVVADRRRLGRYRALGSAAAAHNVARIALPHKYPIGSDPILVQVVTGRRPRAGRSVMTAGAAVVGAAACAAASRWIACGIVPTRRVVTVSGPLAATRGNYDVPIGTACRDLLDPADGVVVCNGCMTGTTVTDRAVVTAATEALLAVHPAPHAAAMPCIRCGWCTDHCPARLNVAAMNDHFELGLTHAARRDGVMACVECGVCSYICPARLPLTERVKRLKAAAAAERPRPVER